MNQQANLILKVIPNVIPFNLTSDVGPHILLAVRVLIL